ncbi:MAG: transglycosylase domain-containing protein, partial [Pseudomonadota bacterium]
MFNHMFRTIFWVWMAALAALTLYLLDAWADAARDAPTLRTEAADIIAAGRGPGALGPGQLDLLLLVEDPAFYDHNGLDLTTPGAGMTSIPQSLAKRLAFDKFRPGISKLRQTAYAISLTRRLTREDILALALDKAEMGPGPEGWVTGFFQASEAFYGRSPAELKDREF